MPRSCALSWAFGIYWHAARKCFNKTAGRLATRGVKGQHRRRASPRQAACGLALGAPRARRPPPCFHPLHRFPTRAPRQSRGARRPCRGRRAQSPLTPSRRGCGARAACLPAGPAGLRRAGGALAAARRGSSAHVFMSVWVPLECASVLFGCSLGCCHRATAVRPEMFCAHGRAGSTTDRLGSQRVYELRSFGT